MAAASLIMVDMADANEPVSLSPAWIDEIPAHRTAVDPNSVNDAGERQHDAAVLRAAATRIDTSDGVRQIPTHIADWLYQLAYQAEGQAELWSHAARRLRAEAADFAREGEVELRGEEVIQRLRERADAITSGRLPESGPMPVW